MDRTFYERWSDFSGRYGTSYCPFCKNQSLDFARYKLDKIAGDDVVAVTCKKCGHVELFNVAMMSEIADAIDGEYHKIGWR